MNGNRLVNANGARVRFVPLGGGRYYVRFWDRDGYLVDEDTFDSRLNAERAARDWLDYA